MPSIKIKEYIYRGFPIQIDFAEGKDWGARRDKFHCNTQLPKSPGYFNEIGELEKEVKKIIDEWCAVQPKTNEEWVELVTSCVIQTGYEDWHVDEQRIMNVLERYADFKKVKYKV